MQHSPVDWMVNGGLGASKNGWYCNGGWGLESFARIIFYECFCLSFSCRGVWFFCLTRMVIFDLPTNRPIRKALPFHVVTLKGFFASPPRLVAFCRAPLRRGTDDFGPWRGHRGLRDLVPVFGATFCCLFLLGHRDLFRSHVGTSLWKSPIPPGSVKRHGMRPGRGRPWGFSWMLG